MLRLLERELSFPTEPDERKIEKAQVFFAAIHPAGGIPLLKKLLE
jgi:hypothetical protein